MKRRKEKIRQVDMEGDDMAAVTEDGRLLHRTKNQPPGEFEDITPDKKPHPATRRRRRKR